MVLDMPWLTIVDDFLAAVHDEMDDKRFQAMLARFQAKAAGAKFR